MPPLVLVRVHLEPIHHKKNEIFSLGCVLTYNANTSVISISCENTLPFFQYASNYLKATAHHSLN